MPILQYIQKSTGFTLAYVLNPLITGILIALSAGIFEEGFRFLFKQFLIKPNECSILQPVIFGLGHGIAEALIVLIPALSSALVSQLGLAFLERALAIILHINLTIVVWNGFQKKKKFIYLLIAITIHGFVNSLIPVFSLFPNSIMLIEGSLAAIDVLMIAYSYHSRKYYVRGRNSHEEIKA